VCTGGLDVAHPGLGRRDDTNQPAAQVAVGGRRITARLRVGADDPRVAWAPKREALALAEHQPGVLEALKMGAHPIGMQAQMLGQLFGVRRPSQLAEQREQPRPDWLRKNIARPGRCIHAVQFCKARLGKPGLKMFSVAGERSYGFPNEHLADRGGGDPALRRIGVTQRSTCTRSA